VASEADLLELLGREPDQRLLAEDLGQLPASVGQPEALPDTPRRRRLVAVGATLTGVTLIGGVALIVVGLIAAVVSGFGIAAIAAIVIGIALVGTHWGWVHVAELSANTLEERRHASVLDRRREWLKQVEPYTRWEVSTNAHQDGAIAIVTTRYRPIPRGERTFTFLREETARETHSADEPAAAVTERAELLRRAAAADTKRERERYEAARDAYETALLARGDEQERLAALRAASEALSERINTNLREPPLTE
jgi:hypothetical protein